MLPAPLGRGGWPLPRVLAICLALFSLASLLAAAEEESVGCSPPSTWPAGTSIPGGGGQRYADLRFWSGTPERLDVLLPTNWSGGGSRPTILFLHGGGGFSGDKFDSSVRDLFFTLVRRGYAVVTANYTLGATDGSRGGFPANVQDARAALTWIRRGSDVPTSGQDVCLSTCIVVVGSSTGARLAALLATTWNADDEGYFGTGMPGADGRADLVVGVSGLYDAYDLGARGACPPPPCYGAPYWVQFPAPGVCGAKSGWPVGYPSLTNAEWSRLPWGSRLPNGLWPPEAAAGCQWQIGPCPQPTPGPLPTNHLTGNVFADGSPANWVDAADPPLYLVHGKCDPLIPSPQAEAFRNLLEAAGVPVVLREIPSSGHGIRTPSSGLDGVLTPEQAADEVETAIGFWHTTGGCARAWAVRYGCGVNPRESLRVLAGRPRLGATVLLGLDNPPGTQAPGSMPYLVLSTAPDPAFPCGTVLSGFGMTGPGFAGELLLHLHPASLQPQYFAGPPWTGPGHPSPVSLPIPSDPVLTGLSVFGQGILVDTSGPRAKFGLTAGVQLVLGV